MKLDNLQQAHLKVFTKSRQISFKSKMKVFAVGGEFQVNMLVLACCPLRSSVLRVQVLCVVIQCLIMRYVFIQAFPCNEKKKKFVTIE